MTPLFRHGLAALFRLCLLLTAVPAGALTLEPVVLQLKWVHQFQFAGYYAALEQGYYREAGLEVRLRANGEGGVFVSPVEEVVAGRAQYGISNSGLMMDYLSGQPVVALAAILQHSAVSWLVLDKSGIRNLHDLADKRLMTVFPLSESVELLAPFEAEGIATDRLTLVPTRFDLQPLLQGEVDAFDAYVTNEPFFLRQLGIPYRLIDPRAYGIDFYGDVLFSSRQELERHPERAAAFRQASLKGWRYAMDHLDEMIELIHRKYAPDKSLAHLRFEAEAMRRLILPDFVEIGHMNPGRWARIAEIQSGAGHAKPLALDDFLYQPPMAMPDMHRYYRIIIGISLLALLLSGFSWWVYRINQRLRQEIRARQAVEAKLRRLSETDALTGLSNRRSFNERLEAAWQRFRREQQPFALLMLDIDWFKRVNDRHGHPVGDRVLIELGQRLLAALRSSDHLARTGGEEFMVLLPDTGIDTACHKAEQLRACIGETPFVLDGRDSLKLTLSIGVTESHPADRTVTAPVVRADQALYRAKREGRNRIVSWVSPIEPEEQPDAVGLGPVGADGESGSH